MKPLLPRVAVTGTTGRVGAALARGLARRFDVIPLPRGAFDLADPAGMADVLATLECEVFINPAGLTSIEACLDQPDLALRVNARAPAELAAWAAARGVHLIHFSTDYTLDGAAPGMKAEDAPVAPVNDYGHSKLAGEQAVLARAGTCVARVSWVFGPEKPSFVDAVAQRALAGEPLAAVADKFSLPTFTADLTEWTAALISARATGRYHLCQSGPPASWHDLATATVAILHRAGRLGRLPEIDPQRLDAATGFRAPRPRHTAMSTTRLTELLGRPPRPWQAALADYFLGS